MPYRRLPKTDQARIKSLQIALEMEFRDDIKDIPVDFALLAQVKTMLPQFRTYVNQYTTTYEQQAKDNKRYQVYVRNARMYISHFIQVLNFTVIRGEMKKETKLLYKLDIEDHNVPDLSKENAMLIWGKNIIVGEETRIRQGGMPLQYPNIGKVKMHYELFKELMNNQNIRKSTTARNWKNVVDMRDKVDDLIKQIWDQVEAHYAELLPYAKYKACCDCGVIYYYRRREAELTPKTDEDIIKNQNATLRIDFNAESQQ